MVSPSVALKGLIRIHADMFILRGFVNIKINSKILNNSNVLTGPFGKCLFPFTKRDTPERTSDMDKLYSSYTF